MLRALAGLCLVGLELDGCGSTASGPPSPEASSVAASLGGLARHGRPAAPRGEAVELYSWFDLPVDEPRARELSGIAWDEATRTLWAVQDESATIVSLFPDADVRRWSFGPGIALEMNFPLDLEGIVVLGDGFIVASEKGPRVLEVDRSGRLRLDVPLPAHFGQARENKSLESLTLSPDRKYLFTTSEEALGCDGARTSAAHGSMLRILRIDRATGAYEEHAYVTDPVPYASGDFGVADLAAVSNDELLVLERGWTRGIGNTARIYRVRLGDPRTSCLDTPALASNAPVLKKTLVVDLRTLPCQGMPPAKGHQESALLDNYEGLTLGPRLPDGRASILLVSDDNARSDQTARILVLALR